MQLKKRADTAPKVSDARSCQGGDPGTHLNFLQPPAATLTFG